LRGIKALVRNKKIGGAKTTAKGEFTGAIAGRFFGEHQRPSLAGIDLNTEHYLPTLAK